MFQLPPSRAVFGMMMAMEGMETHGGKDFVAGQVELELDLPGQRHDAQADAAPAADLNTPPEGLTGHALFQWQRERLHELRHAGVASEAHIPAQPAEPDTRTSQERVRDRAERIMRRHENWVAEVNSGISPVQRDLGVAMPQPPDDGQPEETI